MMSREFPDLPCHKAMVAAALGFISAGGPFAPQDLEDNTAQTLAVPKRRLRYVFTTGRHKGQRAFRNYNAHALRYLTRKGFIVRRPIGGGAVSYAVTALGRRKSKDFCARKWALS